MKEYIIELSDNENALSILAKAYNLHELVRCRYCKHGRLYEQNLVDCELQELATDADWFCADGKRED